LKKFRKPKKAIKVLQVASPMFFGDLRVREEEMWGWTKKLMSSRRANTEATIALGGANGKNAKDKMFASYYELRKDELLAYGLPSTREHESPKREQALKINMKDVEKIRCKSELKKLPVEQSRF
jgi:hypothetical protein